MLMMNVHFLAGAQHVVEGLADAHPDFQASFLQVRFCFRDI